MLNNLAQSEYSVARLVPASARQQKVLCSAQDLLRPVLELLDSGQIHLSGKSDQHQLQGIRQQVINCTTETHAGLLSEELRALGKKLLNDPSFASVGEAILQVVIQAKLPDWKHAQHALQLHLGISDSLFEQVGKTLHGLSETKTLAPMVVAMAGAGLVGRGAKLLGTQLFKSTHLMAKAGEWAIHSAASGAGLIAEAAVFPAIHAGGALLVNQPVELESFLGQYFNQAYHGLTLMGSLRVAGAAAKYTLHGLHGIQLVNSTSGTLLPMATRLRSLTSLTQLTLPATYELGALTYLNTKDHPQQSFAANFAEAIGLAFEFRLAGSLLQTLAPGITAANRALEFKSIQALKTNGLRLANTFSQKLKDLLSGPGTGSGWRSGSHTGLTEALVGVGTRAKIESIHSDEELSPHSLHQSMSQVTATVSNRRHANQLTFNEITLSIAQTYIQEGVDPFPEHNREARDEFLEVATELTDPIAARRRDWMMVLMELFPREFSYLYLEKVDMWDQIHVVKEIKRRATDSKLFTNANIAELTRLSELSGEYVGQGQISLNDFCQLVTDYLRLVDPQCFNLKGFQHSNFPHILLEPTFDRIDYHNYVRRISDRWLMGSHIIALDLVEYIDGDPVASQHEVTNHDRGHSKLALEADRLPPENNTYGLRYLDRVAITNLMKIRLSVKKASASYPNPKVANVAEALWFVLDREEAIVLKHPKIELKRLQQALDRLTLEGHHWTQVARGQRKIRVSKSNVDLRQGLSSLKSFSGRILKPTDLRTLFPPSLDVETISNQEMLEAVQIIGRAFKDHKEGSRNA